MIIVLTIFMSISMLALVIAGTLEIGRVLLNHAKNIWELRR